MSSVRYFLTPTGGIFFECRARSKICEKKPVLGYENLHVVWGRGGIYLLFFSAYVHSIILCVFSEGERIFGLFEGKSQCRSHVSPRNQGFIEWVRFLLAGWICALRAAVSWAVCVDLKDLDAAWVEGPWLSEPEAPVFGAFMEVFKQVLSGCIKTVSLYRDHRRM